MKDKVKRHLNLKFKKIQFIFYVKNRFYAKFQNL